MDKVKSFLKWAGSKYACIERLQTVFPKANRLVEPFVGSAVVFLNADYPHALLSDQNADLVGLFKCLQEEGAIFIETCEQLFDEKMNHEQMYYMIRHQFNHDKIHPRERAAFFLYLNRHGYNGLCRYNQSGMYNVPFGRYRRPYFPRTEMHCFYEKSQRATFLKADFREIFMQAMSGDLIYCDPPYAPLLDQTSNFTSYTTYCFGLNEQSLLAVCAEQAAQRGITVIISNHDTPFTRALYQGAELYSFDVQRKISCRATQRLPAKELLAVFRP